MTIPRLTFTEARARLIEGAILIRQKSRRGDRFFVEPGGQVARSVWTSLRLIPNVVAAGDGGIGGSQTWRWTK